MKILHVNDSLNPGGAETSILELYVFLRDAGVEIKILTFSDTSIPAERTLLCHKDIVSTGIHPRQSLTGCIRSQRLWVKEICPQVIHVHSFFGLLALKLAFPIRREFKVVASLRNLGYDAWPAKTLYQKLRKRIHSYLLHKVDYITAVSQAVADHYHAHLGVTTNQLIPDSVPALALSVSIESHLNEGTENSQLVLAIPGRVTREKGHWVALDAVSSLVTERSDLKLEVLGGGPLQAELEDQCNTLNLDKFVSISGVLDHRELLERLAQADICLIPSLYEGFGIVALEAMALGVPVIASDIGGLSEIITHEVTGILVPSGDAQALSAACKRLVENPELKKSIVNAAREMVLDRYSMDSIGKQWMDMYQTLVSNR